MMLGKATDIAELQDLMKAEDIDALYLTTSEGSDPYATKLAGLENSWTATYIIPATGEPTAIVAHSEANAVKEAGKFTDLRVYSKSEEREIYEIDAMSTYKTKSVAINADPENARGDFLTRSEFSYLQKVAPNSKFTSAAALWEKSNYEKFNPKTITMDTSTRKGRVNEIAQKLKYDSADCVVLISGIGPGSDIFENYLLGHNDNNKSAIIVDEKGHSYAIVHKSIASDVNNDGVFEKVLEYETTEEFNDHLSQSLENRKKTYFSGDMTQGNFQLLESIAKDHIQENTEFFDRIKASKTETEVNELQNAVNITRDIAYSVIDTIKLGMSEKEIYSSILSHIEKEELEPSFLPLVAAAENAANIHHLVPTDYELKEGDLLLLDLGVKTSSGMCSDLTFMVYMGTDPSDEILKLDSVMDAAMESAIETIKPGVVGKVVDESARSIITGAGYPEFKHGTGHPLGFETHDVGPRPKKTEEEALVEGQIVTIEPGIYIEGKLGFRKEIDVYIGKNGAVKLSEIPELICIDTKK